MGININTFLLVITVALILKLHGYEYAGAFYGIVALVIAIFIIIKLYLEIAKRRLKTNGKKEN